MNLPALVTEIQSLDAALVGRAASAVNGALTARNWLIGAYIVEFEQNGEDRAKYGERLIPELAKELGIRGLSPTILRHCRTFYSTYPAIRQSLTGEFGNLWMESRLRISQSLTGELLAGVPKAPPYEILTTLSFTRISPPAWGWLAVCWRWGCGAFARVCVGRLTRFATDKRDACGHASDTRDGCCHAARRRRGSPSHRIAQLRNSRSPS